MLNKILLWLNKKFQPDYVNWDHVMKLLVADHILWGDESTPLKVPSVIIRSAYPGFNPRNVNTVYGKLIKEIKP